MASWYSKATRGWASPSLETEAESQREYIMNRVKTFYQQFKNFLNNSSDLFSKEQFIQSEQSVQYKFENYNLKESQKMSDDSLSNKQEQEQVYSFQENFNLSYKLKKQQKSPRKPKKMKTIVELQQESLIHNANMRRNLFKKKDFVEGEGEINGNTMKMFQKLFDMVWENHDKITKNTAKIESNLQSVQTEFKNFRQRIELDREEMVRDKLNEVHQQWAVTQNKKLQQLERKAYEISSTGQIKHQKTIDNIKSHMAEEQEKLEKKYSEANNLLVRATNILKQAIQVGGKRNRPPTKSPRSGDVSPSNQSESRSFPQRKLTLNKVEHPDLAGQFKDMQKHFEEQLTLAKIELRQEISENAASINETAIQVRRSPTLKPKRLSPNKSQTLILPSPKQPLDAGSVSVSNDEMQTYLEDIYHKSLDQIAKLRKDMQVKFKAIETKTSLIIDQKIQDMPVIMSRKSVKDTRPTNQNMNTLYANEVNIGMGDSIPRDQLHDYVKREVGSLIGEQLKENSQKIVVFKTQINRKLMSFDHQLRELHHKHAELRQQTQKSELELRKTSSALKKKHARGSSARGFASKRLSSAVQNTDHQISQSPPKSPRKIDIKLPVMSPTKTKATEHAFGSALTVPKTSSKKAKGILSLDVSRNSTLQHEDYVTAQQMDNRIAARLKDTEDVLAELQQQFQKASVRLELKTISTGQREKRHHSNQHGTLEDHEHRLNELETKVQKLDENQQAIMGKVVAHTAQIDEEMLQKDQQKMFQKMSVLQTRYQFPTGVTVEDADAFFSEKPEEQMKQVKLLESQHKVVEKIFKLFLAGKIPLKLFNEQIKNFEANAIGLQFTMFNKYSALEINQKLFEMKRFVHPTFINSRHSSAVVGMIIQSMVKASETASGFDKLCEVLLHFMVLLYSRQNIKVANDYEVMSQLGKMLQNIFKFKTLQVDHRGHPIEEDVNKVNPIKRNKLIVEIIQSLEISMQKTIDIEGPQGLNVENLELLGYILDVIEDSENYSFDTIKAGLSVISEIIPMAFENIKSKRNAKVIALIKHVNLEKLKFKLGHIMTNFEENAIVQSLVRNALLPIEKINQSKKIEGVHFHQDSDKSRNSSGQVSYR